MHATTILITIFMALAAAKPVPVPNDILDFEPDCDSIRAECSSCK